MIKALKRGLNEHFIQQPLSVRYLLILTVSIFLPLYITIAVSLAAFLFFIFNKKRLETLIHAPYAWQFLLLGPLLLAMPLIYQNDYGFVCSILFCIYLVLGFYINHLMTDELFRLICVLCCLMSFFCAAYAMLERLFSLQPRVMVFTLNPNYYAYMTELTALLCFYQFVKTKKPVYVLFTGANIFAIILTGCRSAWIALIAGLFVFFGLLGKKNIIYLLVVLAAALFLAVYFDPSLLPRYSVIERTLENRFDIWSRAFQDFLRHPIFGSGLLSYYKLSGGVAPHAHNVLIDLLECTGVAGTAVFCFIFMRILKQLKNSYKYGNKPDRARAALIFGAIAATLTHGIMDVPFMGVQTGLLFFLVLSLRQTPPGDINAELAKKYT